MTNITQSLAYPAETDIWDGASEAPVRGHGRKLSKHKSKPQKLTGEDMEIVVALEAVRSDMEFLHNCFDQTTDAILVDSLIYELKAANLKYQYYLNICKEKGIVCGTMPRG